MSKEEKEAIEQLKSWRDFIIKNKEKVNKANDIEFYLRTALNLIQKQQEELKNKDKIIDFYKQQELSYLVGYEYGKHHKTTAVQIIAEQQQRYLEARREERDRLRIEHLKLENEKKDKIIDELAPRVYLTKEEREELAKDVWDNPKHKGFADFVKRYFEKKVENEGN